MRPLRLIAGLSMASTLHAALNTRLLRRCTAAPVDAAVAVLVPARDEAAHIGACLAAVRAQRQVARLQVLVLDDESTDGTADVVRATGVDLLPGAPPPSGWLGKPHACQQLADACPEADWLVFLDADVRLAPDAVAAAVHTARQLGVDLLSPFPRQLAESPAERLVQPLLAWSWLALVPLRRAERSERPSLAVAAGQFLVVRRTAYDEAGGHAAVRDAVMEDLALARAVRRIGGRTTVADGHEFASCRMYTGWAELSDGYGKSLWSAFGSPMGAVAVVAAAYTLYVVPPLTALAGSRAGMVGYAAAVAGRAITARRTGSPVWPDALAHPVSVATAGWLVLRSLWQRRRRALTWKGRPV